MNSTNSPIGVWLTQFLFLTLRCTMPCVRALQHESDRLCANVIKGKCAYWLADGLVSFPLASNAKVRNFSCHFYILSILSIFISCRRAPSIFR